MEQKLDDFGAESITEGTLMEWKKKPGEAVSKGEILAVIETDKVALEVKAIESGTIQEVLVKTDETVVKGQVLVRIATGSAAAPTAVEGPPPASAPVTPQVTGTRGKIVDVMVKDFGAESITEGTLMEWRKKVGEFAAKGEILAVIETDKVTIDIKAEEAGVLKEIFVEAQGTVQAGKTMAKMEAGVETVAVPTTTSAPPSKAAAVAPAAHASEAPLTGLRAAFARTAAIRAGQPWPPAGASSAAAPAAAGAAAPGKSPAVTVAPAISVGEGRTERRVPISRMRQRVMQRLKETQNTAALLTTFQEADMSAALELRSRYRELFEKKHGAPLGLLSLFVKASACAIEEVPGVNAVIDDETQEMVHRDYVDISIPVPSPRGPVSCVLHGVESMSVRDIEYTLNDLMAKAGKDELIVEDMVSPTFGITDSGVAGGMLGTGIINPPQSAVMGTNAITKRPVAVNGKVLARPVMYLSLTYDHRLIDGREAVTFLCSVRDKMEDPARLLLDL